MDWSSLEYDEQLDRKVEQFRDIMVPFLGSERAQPPVDVVRSSPTGYRMRCEFRVWHEGDRSYYAMNRPGGQQLIEIGLFPAAHAAIQSRMSALLVRVNADDEIRRRLFRVEFLTTLGGETLVTLIYHRPLDEAWVEAATQCASDIDAHIVGRSRKKRLVVGRDFVTEYLTVEGKTFSYRQTENSFTQPNAYVNEGMLSWATRQAAATGGDLLELYCGNGNFTIPLASHFDKVFATELSKISIAALEWAKEDNRAYNIASARLSAAEMASALRRDRPFRRLAHVDLDGYDFRTLFVDPPRAGLDPDTLSMATAFDHVIYVSCNPASLGENLATLSQTHDVVSCSAFDQFPFTPHLECGVVLDRRR